MWGRRIPQPRLTAWYGDPGARYAYSGLELDPLPWTPLLADIKTRSYGDNNIPVESYGTQTEVQQRLGADATQAQRC